MPWDEHIVVDIRTAAERALEFAQGLDKEGFLKDRKTQSAVLHQLLVLGEAAKRLSEGFRARHPDVPWRLVAGMRDRLIHGYNTVDLQEVWLVVERDLPQLLRNLR